MASAEGTSPYAGRRSAEGCSRRSQSWIRFGSNGTRGWHRHQNLVGFFEGRLCGPRRLRLGRFAGRHPVPFRHGRVAYAASCRSFGGHLSRPLRVPQRRKRRSKTSVWHSRCRSTFGSAGRHHGRDFRKFEAVETGSGFLPSICSSWRPWSKKARSSAGLPSHRLVDWILM